jgi:hypothetical protein
VDDVLDELVVWPIVLDECDVDVDDSLDDVDSLDDEVVLVLRDCVDAVLHDDVDWLDAELELDVDWTAVLDVDDELLDVDDDDELLVVCCTVLDVDEDELLLVD